MTDAAKVIARVRELCERATPGPWFAGVESPDESNDGATQLVTVGTIETDIHYEEGIAHVVGGEYEPLPNARLIALAVNVLPALLDVLESFTRNEGGEPCEAGLHPKCAGCKALAALERELPR